MKNLLGNESGLASLGIPPSAFIDPRGRNQENVRGLLLTAVDLILKSLGDAAGRSPSPDPVDSPEFAAVPEEPLPEDVLLGRVAFLLDQSRNLAHPGYIGNMESMPTTMSIVGGLLISAARNNMLAEEMSPFLTRVEPVVMRWFAERFGLGPSSGGQLLAGGTLTNLQALTVARNAHCASREAGIHGRGKRPVFLASDAAHSSLQKAAMVMGLGTSAVIPVRTDANSRMEIDDLTGKIRASLDSDQQPFCIVGTAGTTITGSIDPLAAVAAVAKQFGLWFHVDAIYGGALILSERHRGALSGIEQADSIAFNLHKWGYLANTCSMLLFRDCQQRDEHFRIAAPYMNRDKTIANLGESSLQGSRQADIVPLVLTFQHLGRVGYERLIDSRMDLAAYLRGSLQAREQIELCGEGDTNITCFRCRTSSGFDSPDARTTALQDYLLSRRDILLTLPSYRGKQWLKADILNPFTDWHTVGELVAGIDDFDASLVSGGAPQSLRGEP